MLPDPGAYVASYRESILASLAEQDLVSPKVLEVMDSFARGYSVEALQYADDWTAYEARAQRPPEVSTTLPCFRELVAAHESQGMHHQVLRLLGDEEREVIAEVGPGAGGLSADLAKRCDTLLLIDLSLRSLLNARKVGADSDKGTQVACIVGDVSTLEMASDRMSAIVAANVVDLLDEPEHFLIATSRWLVRRGELIITTPDPGLGGGDNDDGLQDMLEAVEFRVEDVVDGIPWLRIHDPRYSQIYWLQAIRASI
jgi:SAM-dependent methyltransferase